MNIFASSLKFSAAAAGVGLLLAGCASGGSSGLDAGQRMSARGESIAGRGAAWSDGQRDLRKGEKWLQTSTKRAADAEDDLRDARNDLARAERKLQDAQNDRVAAQQQIADGTARMSRAEADYGAIRNQPSVLPPR